MIPQVSSIRVFISYSHDSEMHSQKVRQFSDKLRADGIDCWIDQYEVSREKGWLLWMEKQINEADYVLVFATETYLNRVRGEETTRASLDGKWESRISYSSLYRAANQNNKFIPILFSESSVGNIPLLLQAHTHFVVDTVQGYKELYQLLTQQTEAKAIPLGKVKQHESPEDENTFFVEKAESQPKTAFNISPQQQWLSPSSKDLNTQHEVKELFPKDRMEAALSDLKTKLEAKSTHRVDEVITLQEKLTQIRKQRKTGIINAEREHIELDRIRQSINKIISDEQI